MPKISITPAATFLSGIMIVIVAAVTLSVSYFVVFDSIRDVGQTTAKSLAQNSFVTIDNFLSRPLKTAKAAQRFLRSTNYTLPRDDPDPTPNWRLKWVDVAHQIHINADYNLDSLAFMLADNTLVRAYNLPDRNAALTTELYRKPANVSYVAFVDQYSKADFQVLTNTSMFDNVPHPTTFWDASPHIVHTRALSNNFTMDLDPYFLTTQGVIRTPNGVNVVAATHTVLHNRDGLLLGLVAVNFGVNQLDELLERASMSATANTEVFVIRHTGSLIATTHESKSPNRTLLPPDYDFSQPAHSDCMYPDHKTLAAADWYMTCQVQASEHSYTPLNTFVASEDFKIQERSGNTEQFFYTIRESRETYYVAGQRLVFGSANFTVVLFMPELDVLSEVVAVRNLSLIISICLAVLCCAVTAITMHLMLKPLTAMCAKLSNAAKLKLETDTTNTKKSSVKEVYDLQVAFAEMNDQLRLVRRFVPHAMFTDAQESYADQSRSNSGSNFGAFAEGTATPDEVFNDLTNHASNASTAVLINPLAGPSRLPNQERVRDRVLQAEANKFIKRECSVLCLVISKPGRSSPKDKARVEDAAKETLWRAIQTINENHGVVEQLRPDVFIATFNAHGRCVMHRQMAVRAALTIAWSLTHEISKSSLQFGISIDAGEHLVGTCGSDEQRSTVVIGPAFDGAPALAEMARDRYLSHVIATDVVTKGLSRAVCSYPLDVLDMHGTPKGIFEVVPDDGRGRDLSTRFADAFTMIRQGNGNGALPHLKTLFDDTSDHNHHLQFRAEMLMKLAEVASTSTPHIRPHVPFEWVFSPQEELVCLKQRQEITESNDPSKSQEQHNKPEHSATDDLQSLSTVSHETVGQKLQKALEFKARDEDNSLFPMFYQPASEKGDNKDGGDFPETVVDANQITWMVSKKKLGAGASGAVILGLGEDGSLAALKFVPIFEGAKSPEDLQHEVLMLCDLVHENVTHYVSCAISNNYFVLITEYISGGSLADTIKSFDKLPAKLLKRYAIEMLEGLAYLHGQGIVHCDIKPQNVLVTAEGSCKLADFGSALVTQRCGKSTILRGTAWFMAPEVASGASLSTAADMWSFGVTMLTLNLGTLPFKRLKDCANTPDNFMAALAKREYQFNYNRDGVCRTVQIIADACCAEDPNERLSATKLLSMIM